MVSPFLTVYGLTSMALVVSLAERALVRATETLGLGPEHKLVDAFFVTFIVPVQQAAE